MLWSICHIVLHLLTLTSCVMPRSILLKSNQAILDWLFEVGWSELNAYPSVDLHVSMALTSSYFEQSPELQ